MGWAGFFLSFRGRLSRRSYWLRLLAALLIFIGGFFILSMIVLVVTGSWPHGRMGAAGPAGGEAAALMVAVIVLDFVFYLWAVLAVTARRCHDLGFSGRDMFSFRVANVSLGFRRGTVGPNAYGADPLGPASR